MKVLITGVAGFIGFHLAIKLLNNKFKVDGVDSLDNYYSVKYKKLRILELKKQKNFNFINFDLIDKKKIKQKLNKRYEYIFHFAAQAGVRYSFDNPEKYVDSNIVAFANILNFLKNKKTKKIFYASSSSVYGEVKKFPCKESSKLNPKNIYAFSKVVNERLADFYSKKYKINIIGLRFFTCYGEWGRPDMFLFKLFKSIEKKEYLNLNNYGNHYRDFTYIEDLLKIILKLIKSNLKKHEIFNICSNKPISILRITNLFKNKGLKLRKIKKHPADVYKTHGDNTKVLKIVKNIHFTDPDKAILKTYNWYKSKKIIKNI